MKIIVLAGGLSPERDVSLTSGAGICKTLLENGHQAYLLDLYFGLENAPANLEDVFTLPGAGLEIAKNISTKEPDLEVLKKSRPDQSDCMFGPNVIELCRMADITFVALHGSVGENGKLQAAFDLLGIKYTGCNSFGCALSMNKLVTKQIYKMSGVPTPRGTHLTKETKDLPLSELGYYLPLVVKPCENGSSIGVYICHTEEEYNNAVRESFEKNPDEELVIEPYIKGREFSVAVVDGKAYPIIEIAPKQGFYDYKNKYQAGSTVETCPAEISPELTEKMQHYAEAGAKALCIEGYARFDFMMKENGDMYCLEANTLPGMTPTSLIPQEAKVLGIDYPDLCEELIRISLKKYRK